MRRCTIATGRLLLRPFEESDIAQVVRICADERISRTNSAIPFPYERAHAEVWMATHAELWESGKALPLAITLGDSGELIGSIELRIDAPLQPAGAKGEIGYLIGVPWWGCGFATEASRALIAYGFDELGLARVWAYHFAGNDASGAVMRKSGMALEGTLRSHMLVRGTRVDCPHYGVLRTDPGRPSLAGESARCTKFDIA